MKDESARIAAFANSQARSNECRSEFSHFLRFSDSSPLSSSSFCVCVYFIYNFFRSFYFLLSPRAYFFAFFLTKIYALANMAARLLLGWFMEASFDGFLIHLLLFRFVIFSFCCRCRLVVVVVEFSSFFKYFCSFFRLLEAHLHDALFASRSSARLSIVFDKYLKKNW